VQSILSSRARRSYIVVLLLTALIFMTFLNMEQARVIRQQRGLIGDLARDSFAYFHLIAQQQRQQAASSHSK